MIPDDHKIVTWKMYNVNEEKESQFKVLWQSS